MSATMMAIKICHICFAIAIDCPLLYLSIPVIISLFIINILNIYYLSNLGHAGPLYLITGLWQTSYLTIQ